MRKTTEKLNKIELLTRQVANDLKSNYHYDFSEFEIGLLEYANWLETITKEIQTTANGDKNV